MKVKESHYVVILGALTLIAQGFLVYAHYFFPYWQFCLIAIVLLVVIAGAVYEQQSLIHFEVKLLASNDPKSGILIVIIFALNFIICAFIFALATLNAGWAYLTS